MKQHNIRTFSSRDDASLGEAVAWLDAQSNEGLELVTAYASAHPVSSAISHCFVMRREFEKPKGKAK